ncbi:AraC family transcriptional regulator [Anaerocolumna sp. AGMB13025]|uniref:AraC family transcriptional regulator n=1 Tax=Anaerocolumna sp. AGMB13025 TaxID=3039116 RepID=UPI00241C2C29|nr:AraC family transcriptional regulator [Anaerocolumna sp. AGMB13025]WFR59212.1 AraC family transcriptional regulator [Anaerocolumna sp. AGMB13025]
MDKHIADYQHFQHTDLYVYQCGSLQCENGHGYGPAVRDHFLIHYVHSGKGIFKIDNTIYELKAGNGFLICPDIITFYKADDADPWHYSWIGFHGLKAEAYLKDSGLSLLHPVFEYTQDDFIDTCFYEMVDAYNIKRGGEVKRLAYLYLFLHKLTELNPVGLYYDSADSRRDAYITKALQYIEMNYSRKITIDAISRHVGLNRSYFNSIFKSALHMSLQEYLIEFRIRKACELIPNEKLSIGDIARSIGYNDALLFSKTFKKIKGTTPTNYRNLLPELNSRQEET